MEEIKSQDILPLELGASPITRLTNLYIKILKHKLGTTPVVNYGMAGRTFKTLLKSMTEIQAGAILMVHCNYNSTKDEWLSKQLKLRMYPLTMLTTNVNVYISYLIFERHVEYDDLDTLKDLVYKYIERL